MGDGKYVDRSGKIVLDKDLYRGWDFSDGLAVAMKKGEDLWGYISTQGEFAITPRFATYPNGYVHPFSEGLARIEVKGFSGYIDRSGTFRIKPQFLDGSGFVDGIARVVVEGPCAYFPEGECGFANPVFPGIGKENRVTSGDPPPCKFTYIDKTGRLITQRRFDAARDFSEDLASVRFGSVWGFINKAGDVAIAPKFEDAGRFSSGISKVRVNGSYGYVDRSNAIVIPPHFKVANDFSEGFAVVGNGNNLYWYIDRTGEQAFSGEFAVASPFFKGLAHVVLLRRSSRSATRAYIDTAGRQVFSY